MIRLLRCLGFSLTTIVILWPLNVNAQQHEFVIIDKLGSAPVRSQPNGTDSLGRLPAGSKVEIFEKKTVRSGSVLITWYRVKIDEKYGWISQYVTTGNIITEDIDTGSEVKKRVQGADKLRDAKFDEEAKKSFKVYALKNMTVEWLEYQEDGIIWVRLIPTKYTSKANVQKIAEYLAKAYRLQTNYKKPISVTIWDPYKSKIWAKGTLPEVPIKDSTASKKPSFRQSVKQAIGNWPEDREFERWAAQIVRDYDDPEIKCNKITGIDATMKGAIRVKGIWCAQDQGVGIQGMNVTVRVMGQTVNENFRKEFPRFKGTIAISIWDTAGKEAFGSRDWE